MTFSQSFNFGVFAGYGSSYFNNRIELKKLFDKNANNVLSISLLASYKPTKLIFCFDAGLTFKKVFSNKGTLDFLKIPLGLDFQIGKKHQILFGFGIYGQSLINQTGTFNSNFIDFQLGYYWDLGYCYLINDKYSIFLKIQNDNDISELYRAYGYHMDESVYSFSSIISIGIKYKLICKKGEK